MIKLLSASLLAIVVGSGITMAQVTQPAPTEKTGPSAVPSVGAVKTRPALTDAQAQAWIKKPAYSNDGKNVGDITRINRDASGLVSSMQLGIGGFLGMGETLVDVTPAQFNLEGDRALLLLSAEQVKALPKSSK